MFLSPQTRGVAANAVVASTARTASQTRLHATGRYQTISRFRRLEGDLEVLGEHGELLEERREMVYDE